MRSIEDTRKRWTALFSDNDTPADLRTALKSEQGNIYADELRSICWKAFLLFEDLDRPQWSQKIHESRSAYSALREHFLKYIEHPDDLQSTTDPLADDEESPWQTLRHDEQTRADISQDVERCLQENFFFREPATKSKMIDVLFIYTKLNPDLGYRQGMHELLAFVLWTVDRDAIEPNTLREAHATDEDHLMLSLLDASFVEHDSFTLFCSVMQTARVYFEHGEQRSASGTLDAIPIVHRCQYTHDELLAVTDVELADRLHDLEILPQIFLTRWMRLLFGREFPFEDTLVMWDHLFAVGLRPELVDFVCVAMLLRIRWQLLAADSSSALTLLLRYPSPHPYAPQSFVYDGIYLEQNPTPERGKFIISKYSGKPPELSRRSSQASLRHPRRANLLGDWRGSSEGSSPARSPGRNTSKGLETIFQDVSEGIQRRTESWGVAKAVRGAVSEAKRNMQFQAEAHPRIRYGDSSSSSRNTFMSAETETVVDLRNRVYELEERNRILAKSLNQALNDLRSNMMNMNTEKADSGTASTMKDALSSVRSVQACLEDPSAPLHPTNPKEEKESKENENGNPPAISAPTVKPDVPKKPSDAAQLPPNPAPSLKLDTKPKTKVSVTPLPIRRSPRPALADSEFSWMLGGNSNKSSFVSSASPPPEQARHQHHSSLFGVAEEDGSRWPPSEPDGWAMSSLKGSKGVE